MPFRAANSEPRAASREQRVARSEPRPHDVPSPMPTLIGLPYDASSSFLRGAAEGPPLVREALFSRGANNWSERLVDSIGSHVLRDAGDVALPADATAREVIEESIR